MLGGKGVLPPPAWGALGPQATALSLLNSVYTLPSVQLWWLPFWPHLLSCGEMTLDDRVTNSP